MKKIVVKIGTGVIAEKGNLRVDIIQEIVRQAALLMSDGIQVIIVTSGAIGAGMLSLSIKKRPARLEELQALAAVGQAKLMNLYNEYFEKKGFTCAQILLTQEDFNDRKRFVNIKNTINTLIKHKVVPVINENDTVSTDEIKCGDNDRISSLVADLVEADKLIMLSTVDGLLDGAGRVIGTVQCFSEDLKKLVQKKSELGTGGMMTKLKAAEFAMQSGVDCYIANGATKGILLDIVKGQGVHTCFQTSDAKDNAKKRWIKYGSKVKGAVTVDDGALDAIMVKNKSLLPAGVVSCKGEFKSGDIIAVCDSRNHEVARGVSNYSSEELARIKGKKTDRIEDVIGQKSRYEAIHKDNLVVIQKQG